MVEKQALEKQFHAIASAAVDTAQQHPIKTILTKIRREANINFDPHQQGNLPYVLFDMVLEQRDGSPKKVRSLRLGTPTQESHYLMEAAIIPEFRGFITALSRRHARHLYVSLQRPTGNEAGRTKSLREYASSMSPVFSFVLLNNDCAFYKQKGKFEASQSSDAFMDEFMRQLTQTTDFFLPEALKSDEQFMRETVQVMKYVHTHVFDETPNLALDERKDFIEIFYALFVLFLVRCLGVDSYNVSCKDAIDRAGKTNALIFQCLLIFLDLGNSPSHKRILTTFTHAPAFFVQKRAILKSRKERLISARKRLDHAPTIKRLRELREFFGLKKTLDIEVDQDPNQAFSMGDFNSVQERDRMIAHKGFITEITQEGPCSRYFVLTRTGILQRFVDQQAFEANQNPIGKATFPSV